MGGSMFKSPSSPLGGRPAPRVAPGSTHGRSFGVRIKGAALKSTELPGRPQVAFQKAAVLLGVFFNAPSTVRPLARDPRVLIGWPFPLGFGLDGRLLLARRGRVYV